jgi:energy-converting hydrogenase A subunit A
MNYIIYIIAVVSAIVLALLLKQPLLPEEPKRQSWTISAIFPTAVLAIGFTAMIAKLGYLTNSNMDYIIALAIGVITAVFSKFILEKILPRPNKQDKSSKSGEKSEPPEEPHESKSTDKASQEESNG